MNAKHLLLTHFSARYFKLPPSAVQDSLDDVIEENAASDQQSKHKMSIVMAFDHANMTIGNMWKMNVYMPAIEHNYGYVVGGDEESDVDETSLE
jgi:ribonuclease Z